MYNIEQIKNTIIQGNALEELKKFPDNNIDTVITDPPYGLSNHSEKIIRKTMSEWLNGNESFIPNSKGFMGKSWDAFVPPPALWKEVFRVMKPGATALVFAGSRTQDLMTMSLRLAGFEIKDTLIWLYGSGFPKATDISKQIDKMFGKKPKIIGESPYNSRRPNSGKTGNSTYSQGGYKSYITAPATPEAKLWNGWKSHGLKPAYEPIIMAMKPNEGSYAQNALKWGVAGLNIDGGRIGTSEDLGSNRTTKKFVGSNNNRDSNGERIDYVPSDKGRFPANILLDEEAAKMLDKQSGVSKSTSNDKGGASCFFYCAKASKRERNMGLEKFVIVSIMKVWKENNTTKEEKLAELLVDTDTLPKKDIGVFGMLSKSDLEWSTVLFGKDLMEKYQEDIISTILTETNSTTTSKTFNWLRLLLIKEYTLDVGLLTENGGSRVESVGNSNQLQITINEKTASRLGVKNVQSGTQLKISVREGGNIHSTVKPLKLIEYLVRLTSMPNKDQIYLDPFIGSGTTAMAVKSLGRNYIGIELNPEYIKIAKARIASIQKPML